MLWRIAMPAAHKMPLAHVHRCVSSGTKHPCNRVFALVHVHASRLLREKIVDARAIWHAPGE
eukprot:6174163-Pleurochrysis_carterae.AAC.2